MPTTIPGKTTLSFEDFLTKYGDDARYELIDGELIDLEPTEPHEKVAAFISRKLNFQIESLDLPMFIPHRCLIKLLGTDIAFRPDLILIDDRNLSQEPLWAKEPVITLSLTLASADATTLAWQNNPLCPTTISNPVAPVIDASFCRETIASSPPPSPISNSRLTWSSARRQFGESAATIC
jgi:hypothetical protein